MDPEWIPILVIVLTIVLTLGWLVNNMIKTRQVYRPIGSEGLDSARQVELLSNENAGLKGQVGRLEERIAVLERIATDPAERTAREIDQLR
jgi:hypothetical protein